jgi:FixJ family two-component response regulator
MRRSIERLLQANGYVTAAFASAEEFLQASITESALGLVLDIHLNGMSGLELRRWLSTTGATLPVVFITAHDSEATRRDALSLGCVDYLQKPFEARRLVDALERGAAGHVRTGTSASVYPKDDGRSEVREDGPPSEQRRVPERSTESKR